MNHKHLFLTVLRTVSLRSRYWQNRCLMRANFWVHSHCLLTVSSHVRRDERSFWGLLYESTSPILGGGEDSWVKWPNHLQGPHVPRASHELHNGVGISTCILEAHTHSGSMVSTLWIVPRGKGIDAEGPCGWRCFDVASHMREHRAVPCHGLARGENLASPKTFCTVPRRPLQEASSGDTVDSGSAFSGCSVIFTFHPSRCPSDEALDSSQRPSPVRSLSRRSFVEGQFPSLQPCISLGSAALGHLESTHPRLQGQNAKWHGRPFSDGWRRGKIPFVSWCGEGSEAWGDRGSTELPWVGCYGRRGGGWSRWDPAAHSPSYSALAASCSWVWEHLLSVVLFPTLRASGYTSFCMCSVRDRTGGPAGERLFTSCALTTSVASSLACPCQESTWCFMNAT